MQSLILLQMVADCSRLLHQAMHKESDLLLFSVHSKSDLPHAKSDIVNDIVIAEG